MQLIFGGQVPKYWSDKIFIDCNESCHLLFQNLTTVPVNSKYFWYIEGYCHIKKLHFAW